MSTNPDTTTTAATPNSNVPGVGPLIDQAKAFAKARPWASATLAGVIGIALINTLRGKS
ncbi:hypothetical protein [Sphingomonas nostoxanthinifaciens]|uniref:hypothetical protein n=1 Tax=Sphingomonas nostoxanthinifaciens TaxID=2872652 RepID=UPI001CC1EFCC|nr:hypothetical protein [Sphingomonas nostoxanthinifaciens]UAK23626.1 hypothetical protein K8P63_14715 [Sphingomonas nostoxanthinifaciens]